METSSRAALKQVRELVSDMRTVTMTEELANIQHILKTGTLPFNTKETKTFQQYLPSLKTLSVCVCGKP